MVHFKNQNKIEKLEARLISAELAIKKCLDTITDQNATILKLSEMACRCCEDRPMFCSGCLCNTG